MVFELLFSIVISMVVLGGCGVIAIGVILILIKGL